jgi:hypothetical protein
VGVQYCTVPGTVGMMIFDRSSTVQYSTVQYSTVQYSTVQYEYRTLLYVGNIVALARLLPYQVCTVQYTYSM